MTTVLYQPEEYRLRLEGHANATEDGMDPICAGASALAWALVESASDRPDYSASVEIDPYKPLIDVRCRPDEEAQERCRYMFEVILGGLALIAEAFPEDMQIKVGG